MELSEFLQKLTETAQTIAEQVAHKAPAAWDLIAQALAIQGVSYLLLGATMIATGGYTVYYYTSNYEPDEINPDQAALIMGGLVVALFGSGFFFYIWNWVAIFAPEIYIAHKALDGIL